MFDIEQAKQSLQQRIAEMDAEIAVRTREVAQGMLVERELAALIDRRNDTQRRLSAHDKSGAAD